MAFVLNDRVKETTTTTGTGTVNLGGAATGFETFVAGVGNSNSTYYCIAGQTTAEFEVGIGTVTDASPDTLSRTTILSSSNSDSAVDFSAGTKDVFCTLPAAKTIREFDTAVNIPTGTTAQRSSSAAAGDFRYNTSTGRFEGYSSAWNALGGSNTFSTDIFAGDGSDTTFTLSQSIENENDLVVFIDGVFQAHNSYSVSGTTLTFSTAPADGRVITAYSVKSAVSGNNVTISTMDGDGSDTTLTLVADPVNENNVQVYIDGVYQNKDTFAVSGTTLTFSAAPPNGTKVEAITLTQTNINTATQLADADGDTKVQVEESSDEDTIRMDIAGTEVLTLTNSAMTLKGTTPTLTIGDAGAEDTKIVFDGNAQDYYIGLDDSADDLIIGKGSTVGTTPAVVIDENLNVGIGTTSPAHLLELVRSSTDFGATLEINNTSSANGSVSAVRYVTENETTGLMIGKHSNGFTSGADLAFINQELNSDLTISTNNTERMRIDSSGNVGIGTTSPARPLEVTGSGDTLVRITGGSSNAKGIEFYKGSGTATQLYNVSDDLRIFTNATERMRIDSNGKVTVDPAGTFADDSAGVLQLRASSATGGWAISARSTVTTSSGTWFIGKQSNGTNVFSLVSDSDSIDLTFLSDERMKMNITDSADVLDKVKQITVKDFDWRTELNGDTKDNTRETKKYGFIAQNFQSIGLGQYVKEVMPTDENDDTLGMDYGNITPILVKAIQEQQTLIETLQAKVEALENG